MLLGFDIGGTKSAVVLGKKSVRGNIELLDKILMTTDMPAPQMLDALLGAGDALLQKNRVGRTDISGIGISCGGPLDSKKGIILSPPNLPGWDHVPIVDITQNHFGIKTSLQNDANAGAVAEWKFGAGKGFNNLLFLTYGTGMGAGLILDGRLYSGPSDLAGEVGHMRLAPIGPVGFGKAGSFEGFCSGGGIAQLAQMKVREKLQMGEKVSFCNSLEELHRITAKSVAEAAFAGDMLAKEIYRTSAQYLGQALALLIDILNPECIILGSIYVRAQSLIEPYMQELIDTESIKASVLACKVVPAALGESIGDLAALALADAIGA